MARDGAPNGANGSACDHVRFIPRSYDRNDSRSSALQLILTTLPEWSGNEDSIQLIRCTEGMTNTLLKVVNHRPGLSKDEAEKDAVLLRAYGNGTDVIIDRARETQNHETLMRYDLAPMLLARFQNGMIYRYIPGTVTQPADLRTRPISLAIARRLAQWHAIVPCQYSTETTELVHSTGFNGGAIRADNRVPSLWTIMQKWISALPTETKEQRHKQSLLQNELKKIVEEFSQRDGLGQDGLVFAHCDLLSGNVIVLPDGDAETPVVSFIDYEYATPSPAAFDIANHFAEWTGFDCDYNAIPTLAQRREFVQEYARAYFGLRSGQSDAQPADLTVETEKLLDEVNMYRGIPGFYWGIWALIQSVISYIDFDYASYAESRLGEYWAWRAQLDGSLDQKTPDMQLRERRWAQAE
jgi:ethanolamine kinase